MKVHNYKPNLDKKHISSPNITHHPLGHECTNIFLDMKEEKLFTSEGILINGVFVGMCTITYRKSEESGEYEQLDWTMVFNELNRRDLKRIGKRFKYCAPLVMLPYIESTSIPIEDWPFIYNAKSLKYKFANQNDSQELIEVSKYNGKLDHQMIFTL